MSQPNITPIAVEANNVEAIINVRCIAVPETFPVRNGGSFTHGQVIDVVYDEDKEDIYRRAGVIRLCTFLDFVFLTIIFGISISQKKTYWIFCFFLPLVIAGYFGAKLYMNSGIICYFIYLLIMCASYLFYAIQLKNVFFFLLFFLDLFILIYCYRFIRILSNPDNTERVLSLQNGWYPHD